MELYIGLDVSLASTAICVVSAQGKVIKETTAASEPEDLVDVLRAMPGSVVGMQLVNPPLDDDMRAGFQCRRSRLGLELGSGEGAFDVTRARVVPLDQVQLVAVHYPDHVRQFGRAVRVKSLSQPRRRALDLDRQVCQAGRYVLFEEAWFDPAGRLYHFLPILCLRK